jgi:hypothetical protein
MALPGADLFSVGPYRHCDRRPSPSLGLSTQLSSRQDLNLEPIALAGQRSALDTYETTPTE